MPLYGRSYILRIVYQFQVDVRNALLRLDSVCGKSTIFCRSLSSKHKANPIEMGQTVASVCAAVGLNAQESVCQMSGVRYILC